MSRSVNSASHTNSRCVSPRHKTRANRLSERFHLERTPCGIGARPGHEIDHEMDYLDNRLAVKQKERQQTTVIIN